MSPFAPGVLALHFSAIAPRLVRRLRAEFPAVCGSTCEDAVSVAVAAGLESAGALDRVCQKDGPEGLFRWLHLVAWRAVRGALRRASSRREGVSDREPAGGADPAAVLLVREDLRRAEGLLDEAAHRFGGPRVPALRAALSMRFTEECTDGEAAAAHGVHRETVNRARSWVRQLGRVS